MNAVSNEIKFLHVVHSVDTGRGNYDAHLKHVGLDLDTSSTSSGRRKGDILQITYEHQNPLREESA